MARRVGSRIAARSKAERLRGTPVARSGRPVSSGRGSRHTPRAEGWKSVQPALRAQPRGSGRRSVGRAASTGDLEERRVGSMQASSRAVRARRGARRVEQSRRALGVDVLWASETGPHGTGADNFSRRAPEWDVCVRGEARWRPRSPVQRHQSLRPPAPASSPPRHRRGLACTPRRSTHELKVLRGWLAGASTPDQDGDRPWRWTL